MIFLFEQEEAVKRYGNRMRAEGYVEGYAEGYTEGYAEGFELYCRLLDKLLSLDRMDDVWRTTTDVAYRERLFEEFNLT